MEYYAILTSDGSIQKRYNDAGMKNTQVGAGLTYNLGTNPELLDVEQLRELIRDHADPSFVPV